MRHSGSSRPRGKRGSPIEPWISRPLCPKGRRATTSTREARPQRCCDCEPDGPAVRAMEDLVPGGPYKPRRAAELVAEMIHGMLSPERAPLAVARYELVLEARRRPEFQAAFNEVRRDLLLLTEQFRRRGCTQPREHAPEPRPARRPTRESSSFSPRPCSPMQRWSTTWSASSLPAIAHTESSFTTSGGGGIRTHGPG